MIFELPPQFGQFSLEAIDHVLVCTSDLHRTTLHARHGFSQRFEHLLKLIDSSVQGLELAFGRRIDAIHEFLESLELLTQLVNLIVGIRQVLRQLRNTLQRLLVLLLLDELVLRFLDIAQSLVVILQLDFVAVDNFLNCSDSLQKIGDLLRRVWRYFDNLLLLWSGILPHNRLGHFALFLHHHALLEIVQLLLHVSHPWV